CVPRQHDGMRLNPCWSCGNNPRNQGRHRCPQQNRETWLFLQDGECSKRHHSQSQHLSSRRFHSDEKPERADEGFAGDAVMLSFFRERSEVSPERRQKEKGEAPGGK